MKALHNNLTEKMNHQNNHFKTEPYETIKEEDGVDINAYHNTVDFNTEVKSYDHDIGLSSFGLEHYDKKVGENSLGMDCWAEENINLSSSLTDGNRFNNCNNLNLKSNTENDGNNTVIVDNKEYYSLTALKVSTEGKVFSYDNNDHSGFDKDNFTMNGNGDTNADLNMTLPGLSRKILSWPSGPWDDGPRRSAFQPYKPATVLTNLQRGNIQAKTQQLDVTQLTWHMKAGRGDLRIDDIINVHDINEQDDYGMTALMWSAAYGQSTTVQRLLERGSDPKIRGNGHQTALHMAAYGGHHEIIKLLTVYGADVNATDSEGNTPLMYAVYEDHPHAVHELLLGDADLCICNFNNIKPYNLAIERNCNQAKIVIESHMINLLSGLIA